MKKLTLLFLFISSAIFSQKNINNYKYIIVPKQFDFLSKADQYQTSSLTKFLFNKKGFTTFLSDEVLPEQLSNNRCLALTANVISNSNMFTTKNSIELRDCNNILVFTTEEGKSKLKDYKRAYHDAIRKAFKSIEALSYAYQPLENVNNEVSKQEDKKVVVAAKTNDKKITSNVEPVADVSIVSSEKTLYAQPIENGFQLVDAKPAIVFQLLKTNTKDYFILKNKKGVFYKDGLHWVAEYYEDNQQIKKQYQVKF